MNGRTARKCSITANQCRKIHALKNAMAMTDDEYRALLHGMHGVETCTVLSLHAAGALIEELEGMAISAEVWKRKEGSRQRFNELSGRSNDMATPAQLRKIEAIWQEVSRVEDPTSRAKALRSFIERTAKVSDLRFLSREGSTKIINALTTMQKHKLKASGEKKQIQTA